MLTSKQKKYLKSQAHALKPLVLIGKSGVNNQSVKNINEALEHHELIKIKFIAFKTEKDELKESILKETNSEFVGMIGHVLTIYSQAEEKEDRRYTLPV